MIGRKGESTLADFLRAHRVHWLRTAPPAEPTARVMGQLATVRCPCGDLWSSATGTLVRTADEWQGEVFGRIG